MNEEINSNTGSASSSVEPTAIEVMSLKPKKSSFWKFMIAFAAIILLVLGGYWLWNNRLSPEAKQAQEMNANYDRYFEYQKNLEEAMRADTYGGKTPEETLQLFIEALRKNDIDLAFQYFILEEDGKRDPKWREGLIKTRDAGKLGEVADSLSGAEPDLEGRAYEKDYKFNAYKNNEFEGYIDMEFNEYSGVWKIESL